MVDSGRKGSYISHIVKVNTLVTDLDALEAAAPHVGLRLIRDVDRYSWYFRRGTGLDGKCEHKLQLLDHMESDFEIGLVPREDHEYGWQLAYDPWGEPGRRLHAAAGKDLQNLKTALAVEVSTRYLAMDGYTVSKTVDANGVVTLTGVQL
jgi:hypothetical protein